MLGLPPGLSVGLDTCWQVQRVQSASVGAEAAHWLSHAVRRPPLGRWWRWPLEKDCASAVGLVDVRSRYMHQMCIYQTSSVRCLATTRPKLFEFVGWQTFVSCSSTSLSSVFIHIMPLSTYSCRQSLIGSLGASQPPKLQVPKSTFISPL